ncbi:MAG TPA: hypothetical protein VFG25_00795 [Nitrosopumilaceae archaeon]|nr:hypothetical protein [Nitrosopumilaceae archaeon]
MATIFEIASTNYEDDIFKIKKALSHLQTTCEITDGYIISKPVSRFGWTFTQLLLKPAFSFNIEKKFADMIKRYKGKQEEKYTDFMQDFFLARDCKIKLKLLEY